MDQENLLYFQGKLEISPEPTLTQEIIRLHHDDPLASHFGIARTKELIQRKFHWPGLAQEVEKYKRTCSVCQGVSSGKHLPYGELQSLPRPQGPWQELAMDFVTGLPDVQHNQQKVNAILMIVNRFTKYTLLFPTTTTLTATQLAKLFHSKVELIYGAPRGIVTNRGPLFTSHF